MKSATKIVLLGTIVVLVSAVLIVTGRTAKIPEQEATGPQPVLPAPSKRIFPTINIADAKGWPAGAKPIPASGLAVIIAALANMAHGTAYPRADTKWFSCHLPMVDLVDIRSTS